MAYESPTMRLVKSFILKEFLPGEDPAKLTATTPLMSNGILDSLATLKLITFLEREFDIRMAAYELDPEHFDTLEKICRLVDSKTSEKTGEPAS